MKFNYKIIILLSVSVSATSFAHAGAAEGLKTTQQANLVKEREKMYALFYTNRIHLLDGCKQLSPGSENKGEDLMFPIRLASPMFVDTSGVVAGFILKNSRLERVWCLGSGDKPKVLNLNKYKNPVWKIEAGNFQRGTELGKMPNIPDIIDIYTSSVFQPSATSQYSLRHGSICSKTTSDGPSGIIVTEPCKK